ncbi:MAG: 50S ribosomal protein L6 [Anaerolineales bacterium]|nr:50S ribosomal protein L6 [Anaerolineales bacterium]MCL4258767.1 50S ribosomal protein L6 [Anaerolineales bacterium]
MSRVGRLPIEIPSGVEVSINGSTIKVKGPKGELSHTFPAEISFEKDGNNLEVKRNSEEKFGRSIHGTARAVVNNMVVGTSQGFTKTLEVQGVGYRAEVKGKNLVLHVGYSNPVEVEPPVGISYATAEGGQIIISGHDKVLVGETAARIRKVRPPEPYKGKGIRYQGEFVRLKAGKAAKAASG